MIGFTQYSPAVLALLVNRDKFFPFVVHNTSEITCTKITDFLSNTDGRIKVLMVAGIDILVDLIDKFDLYDIKIIVLDTIPNLSRAELEIQDAQKRSNGSYQFFTITPSDLNKALVDCSFGIPESGIKSSPVLKEVTELKAKIIRKNLDVNTSTNTKSSEIGELGEIVKDILSNSKLGKREEYIVIETIMKYIVGLYNKRKYKSISSTYNINEENYTKIVSFLNTSKGKAVRIAFMDVNIYNTVSSVAIKEARASKLDFDFITSILPIDKEYEYVIEIPSKLVKKRKSILTESKD